jgi:hypothetical protein
MRKLEASALAWLAAFCLPVLAGYSVRAAAVCTVLVMALSAPAILLGVDEITKGTR